MKGTILYLNIKHKNMTEFDIFIDHWHQITHVWSIIAIGVAVFIFMYYFISLSSKRTLTKKYEFINSKEIRLFWYAGLSAAISFALFINALIVRVHNTYNEGELTAKVFVSMMIGLVLAYSINKYLYGYYPINLAKKLHGLRFSSRHNPANNNKMRMLTEEEEDEHLTEEMIEQENIYANEYDVWIDEETGFKIIEKYPGDRKRVICENCNYRTTKLYKEETEKEATGTHEGLYVKSYRCSHCDHVQRKESTIPALIDQYKK